MSQRKTEDQLAEPRRQEIFQALVEAQDNGMSVAVSLKHVAEQFGVTEYQIKQIEREGLDRQWPPL